MAKTSEVGYLPTYLSPDSCKVVPYNLTNCRRHLGQAASIYHTKILHLFFEVMRHSVGELTQLLRTRHDHVPEVCLNYFYYHTNMAWYCTLCDVTGLLFQMK
jgi:hypothetical protein